MMRWLFNLATLIALLFFITTAVFWVRSYFVEDCWRITALGNRYPGHSWPGDMRRDRRAVCFGFVHGTWECLLFASRGDTDDLPAGIEYMPEHGGGYPQIYQITGVPGGWQICGLGYSRSVQQTKWGCRISMVGLLFPSVLPAIGFGFLPARWMLHRRKNMRINARRNRGLCVRCGYDLRATPGRCSECGHVQDPIHSRQGC
jgi:hypothetical protein